MLARVCILSASRAPSPWEVGVLLCCTLLPRIIHELVLFFVYSINPSPSDSQVKEALDTDLGALHVSNLAGVRTLHSVAESSTPFLVSYPKSLKT